jgi:NADPH:quinone reductase-like Zn-dependent oxidoreductase
MRAIAVADFGAQPDLHDLPVPEPGSGEVLIRVHAASVNGFDVAVASGMLKGMMDHRFPAVLGKDYAGTVEAVGEDVTRVTAGDEVFGVLMRDYVGDGTFAQFVVVPEAVGLTKVPSGLDRVTAGALGLAGTAAHDSIEAIMPSSGETVLISGATGGVGSQAVQLAVARGAEVIATAQPGEEADFAKGIGAHHTVDYTGDIGAQIRAITPEGVNSVIHLVGDGLQLANFVAPGGRFASTLGVGPDQFSDKDLQATAVVALPTADVLNWLAAEVVAGRLRVPVQRTYNLEEAPQAIGDFGKGTLGKLAITIA